MLTMERQPSDNRLFDTAAIGEALACPPERRGPDVVGFNLTNDHIGISLRLDVIEPRRAVSLYLRGVQGFLGFVHIERVEKVVVDKFKGEVTFISPEDGSCQMSVQSTGVFLVTQR